MAPGSELNTDMHKATGLILKDITCEQSDGVLKMIGGNTGAMYYVPNNVKSIKISVIDFSYGVDDSISTNMLQFGLGDYNAVLPDVCVTGGNRISFQNISSEGEYYINTDGKACLFYVCTGYTSTASVIVSVSEIYNL